ncbi:MAG: peptide ABC transporter substrate-binding protein [Candidatus Eremiobacteraeota bacterium]|nr:peptide ABC transporter substrate-binding protein [Candidatus Eremiobacteraeota bacterium]
MALLCGAGCASLGPKLLVGPREKGSVRFNLAADPANLNPLFAHQDAASVEGQLARLAFEPFIDIDQRGRSTPALLAVVPTTQNGGVSADGRTLTYRLRPEARWQDGYPVTAADVIFTLKAILDTKNPVRSHAGYDLIDKVSSPTASTVVFHLRRAWAPAVQSFFSYGLAPQFVLPKHILEKQQPLASAAFNAAPIGNGPFRFVSWHRGERLLYVANTRYWRGIARVGRVDIRIVGDPSTNLTLLRSGEVDFNLIAPAQQKILSGDRNIAYRYVPTATVAGIAINLRHPPLDDVRVRRAIAMSIDRKAISDKITLGRYPVTESAQPQFSWAYDPTAKQPGFAPHSADRLLEKAGWRRGENGIRTKNAKQLTLTYVQFPESQTGVRAATMIQSQLQARGIDITIKSIGNAQLFMPAAQGGALASGSFDLAYVPWPMGSDPDDSLLLACNGASNYMRYCNPYVQRLENAALSTTSRAARKSVYSKIAHIVAQDVPLIYLFNANYIYAYRSQLRGFYPNAFTPTWNAHNWAMK